MIKPKHTFPRGDSITVQTEFPGADLTGATIRATLKSTLDSGTDDAQALWKDDFDPSNPDVSDDPTTGVCFITVPAGGPSTDGTYQAVPGKEYYLDIEAEWPGTPPVVKSMLINIVFDKDGTRRQV